jgi:hypothetical protein
MARMVSTELLTEEAVRKQIRSSSFMRNIESNISAITSELLGTPLGKVAGGLFPGDSAPLGGVAVDPAKGVPDGASSAAPALGGLLGPFSTLLGSAFAGFTSSEGFSILVKELIRYFVGELSRKPVGSVLADNRTLEGFVTGLISGLNSERGRAEIRAQAASWVRRQFRENVGLDTFFSEEDTESIARFVDSIYPSLIQFFIRWLRSEGTRRELIIRGRFLVQDIVDRLNGIQRFIITAAQYQRTLDDNMEGIIDDALSSIEDAGKDPESRRKLVEAVRKELLSIRRRGLADVARKQEEALERTAGALAERAVGALSGAEFRQGVLNTLVGSGNDEDRTVGELLDGLFGLEGGDPGDFLVELIFPGGDRPASGTDAPGSAATGAASRRPAAGNAPDAGRAGSHIVETVRGFFRGFVESHREMRIGEFLGMDEATKSHFDSALATTLIATVDARVPEILDSVDIHDLVVSKINGLNIEEVESLLLRVIEKHLRWINIFGAILGALIGLIQDLLRLLQLSS